MLSALRHCFPDAYIAMLLRRYTGEIMEGHPHCNELLWYDSGSGLVPFGAMCRTLRMKQFDAVVVVYPTFRLAWLMFRAGIPIRVGTGYRYYSLLFNRRVYEHRKDALRHEVEYNMSLLGELDCSSNLPLAFEIPIPEAAQQRVHTLLDQAECLSSPGYVVIHPGSGGSAREWSPERFGILAERIHRGTGLRVIVTGMEAERDKVERVVRNSNGSATPFAGVLSMKELAALIKGAALFVSNSTGPLHVAAAVGTAVIGLYPQHTPMSARRWGPYSDRKTVFTPDQPLSCEGCSGGKELCACMESISIDEVYQAAHTWVADPSRRKTANA